MPRADYAVGGGLGYKLALAAHHWKTGLAEVLKPFKLTPPQFFAVMSLYRYQIHSGRQPSQRQLAERIAMDPNTASQVIRGLEKRGLIIRSPHAEHQRAVALALTTEGLALAKKAGTQARAYNTEFFAKSSPERLHEELKKLTSHN
jgi:DNA-binding MarR family transcriptional regulator